MVTPQKPPLNGRNLSEFYLSSETAKRTVLRAYARPPKQQKARILMYDPVRRIVPEYFASGQPESVLTRCMDTLARRQFDDPEFDDRYHKSNLAALAHLRDLNVPGQFENVHARRASVRVGTLDVLSTTDFYARHIPTFPAAKARDVAVIVYPSGIKKRILGDRLLWAGIEAEVSFRAAAANGTAIDEVIYVDLPRNEVHRFKKPKARLWAEIDATCERIYRDWRDIRLEAGGYGEEQG